MFFNFTASSSRVACGNLSFLMVGTFLLVNLLIGCYYSTTTTTFRAYAVGNKNFSTATLVTTILATCFSDDLLYIIDLDYSNVPKSYVMFPFFQRVFYLFFSCLGLYGISILAKRMPPCMNHLSIGETLEYAYGKSLKKTVVINYIFDSLQYLTFTATTIYGSMSHFIGKEYATFYTGIIGLIIISYASIGGISAITFTDMAQFFVFSVVIPILTWVAFTKINNSVEHVYTTIQNRTTTYVSLTFCPGDRLFKWAHIIGLGFVTTISYITSPALTQRIYMASNSLQASKAFYYAFIFSILIVFVSCLMHLFIYVNPDYAHILGLTDTIHTFIANLPESIKILFVIGLLALIMSSWDSVQHSCAILITHDLMGSFFHHKPNIHIRITKIISYVLGALGVCIGLYVYIYPLAIKMSCILFHFHIFLRLTFAPCLILAMVGFKTSKRAIVTGIVVSTAMFLTIKVSIMVCSMRQIHVPAFLTMRNINIILCAIMNFASILCVHYFVDRPKDTGCVQSDRVLRAIQEETIQKHRYTTKVIKNFLSRLGFYALELSPTRLLIVGCYILTTTIISFIALESKTHCYWYVIPTIIATMILFYANHYQPTTNALSRKAGCVWLTIITLCLPAHLILCCHHPTNLIVLALLSLAHLSVMFILLPLYLGLLLVGITSCLVMHRIHTLRLEAIVPMSATLGAILVFGIFLFILLLYNKINHISAIKRLGYLRGKHVEAKKRRLKKWNYTLNIHKADPYTTTSGAHPLEEVVDRVTDSIRPIGQNELIPIYKKDFQAIIRGFKEWGLFLKRREEFKGRMLLQPQEVTLKYMRQMVAKSLQAELEYVPTISITGVLDLPKTISCDPMLISELLVLAILRTMDLTHPPTHCINIQLHTTQLAFYKSDPKEKIVDQAYYKAIAMVISPTIQKLPEVKSVYQEKISLSASGTKHSTDWNKRSENFVCLDLKKHKMERIIDAHYGQIEFFKDHQAILMVIPVSVQEIHQEIVEKLPLHLSIQETDASKKELADSLIGLMDFYEQIIKIKGIQPDIIGGILLLLRSSYQHMKHATGELCYIRTIRIAETISKWMFHSSNVIYATLLYDLVRYTKLPLSYIESNFGIVVTGLVERLIIQELEASYINTTLYVGNQLQTAVNRSYFSTIFIKFAERLHDLSYAKGYIEHNNKQTLRFLIAETSQVYLPFAKKHFYEEEAGIIKQLEEMLSYAQEVEMGS